MSNTNNNKAIALCRVSTNGQLLDGNLEPQEERIIVAAEYLEVDIVKWWKLAISSRKGKNVKRKDLLEMYAYCRQHKNIRYLIVDEVDRFMRSVDEYYYWKVKFKNINVQLRHANRPELNPDDPMAVFEELIEVYKAEQSNNERITKTAPKMMAKIQLGYYPGNARPGYKKSETKGFHVPDKPRWTALRDTFKELAAGQYTIDEGLKRLHERGYTTRKFGPRTKGGKHIDMYRFKELLCEPYYAGIVKMADWSVVNEHGLHEAMITPEEHYRLVALATNKGKKFTVNRHNPEFPMTNMMDCTICIEAHKEHPRFVGYRHSNGKKGNSRKEYMRYRCRECNRGALRKRMHEAMDERMQELILTDEKMALLKSSLRRIWRQTAQANMQQVRAAEGRLDGLKANKSKLITSLAANPDYADDTKDAIKEVKEQIAAAELELSRVKDFEQDFIEFSDFAIDVVHNWSQNWWALSHGDRERCKQILFPAGFSFNENEKVYTPELSIVYREWEGDIAPNEAKNTVLEGHLGLEPRTPCLRGRCSNQLS
jgi:DNA invertase Pin-like site-specific DNA recombinase